VGDWECTHNDECLSWTDPGDNKDRCASEVRPGVLCGHAYKDHKNDKDD
jgi:hypothetical protein